MIEGRLSQNTNYGVWCSGGSGGSGGSGWLDILKSRVTRRGIAHK